MVNNYIEAPARSNPIILFIFVGIALILINWMWVECLFDVIFYVLIYLAVTANV